MKWYLLGFIAFAVLAYVALLFMTLERQKTLQYEIMETQRRIKYVELEIRYEKDPARVAELRKELPTHQQAFSALMQRQAEILPLKRMRYVLIVIIFALLYPLVLSLQRGREVRGDG